MMKYWNRLRRPIVLLVTLVILLLTLLSYLLKLNSEIVKGIGMTVQIIGILTVVIGIRQKSLKIKRSFWLVFFPWMVKKSPPIEGEPIGAVVEVPEGRVKPTAPKTIEEMPAYIEGEIKWHCGRIEKDYQDSIKRIKERFTEVQDSMNQNFNELYNLSSIGRRDIEIEFIGAICLIYGTILATFPNWFVCNCTL